MRRPWGRGLAIVLLLAPLAAADSHGSGQEEQAELTHGLVIQVVDPTHATVVATASFAESLTADIRGGNDLDGDESVDALEREAFENLMNDRLQSRPWAWNLTADGAPLTMGAFEPYAAFNIEGPVNASRPVHITSRGNVSTDAASEGDTHTWSATVDPAAEEAALTLDSFMVMLPANHSIVSVEGLQAFGDCAAVASGLTPWQLSFAYAEGKCTTESLTAATNESLEAMEEDAERVNPTAGDKPPAGDETIPVDGPADETGAEPSAPTTETDGDDTSDPSAPGAPTDDPRTESNATPAPAVALLMLTVLGVARVMRRLG